MRRYNYVIDISNAHSVCKAQEGMARVATMTDEAKAKRAEYMRAWRARNPERVREQNRRYWERRAEQDGQGDGWQQQSARTSE